MTGGQHNNIPWETANFDGFQSPVTGHIYNRHISGNTIGGVETSLIGGQEIGRAHV